MAAVRLRQDDVASWGGIRVTAMATQPVSAAFRRTPDGAALDLGVFRWVRAWLAGIPFFSAVAVGFYLWLTSLPPMPGPVTPTYLLAFWTPIVLCVAIAMGLAVAVALRAGTWSLGVSPSGIRIGRSGRPAREVPWSRIARVQWGAVAVRVSRYRTELAEGLWIEVRGRGIRRIDTARFRVRAADLDAMAVAVREAAVPHGVPTEPFPMMGRDRL